MKSPQRFPLSWPAHRPRTAPRDRQPGTFSMTGPSRKPIKVNMEAAARRLEGEIERLGGVYSLLSSNLEQRLDGTPRVDRGAPSDPGVCVYFQIRGTPYAMACDTFQSVAQNIAAIAAHIEATRRIERYGVASATETLQAFLALPGPTAVAPRRAWHEVLGFGAEDEVLSKPTAVATAIITAVFGELAKKAHPDAGGSDAAMAELNLARQEALKRIGDAT